MAALPRNRPKVLCRLSIASAIIFSPSARVFRLIRDGSVAP
jgi:hypothetical protein